jgi:N-methylhydantoinase B/oxoprolinase/acetone carboxylase alpha subunit
MAAQYRDEPRRGGTLRARWRRAQRTWKFHINGKSVRDAKKLTMQPADVVLFETPGGGGYGTPPNQLIAYPQCEPGRIGK